MKKKPFIAFVTVIALLVIIRLCMPYVLLYYITQKINKIPEYKAKIADIDIHLYRGSYTIKNLQLWKINKNISVPFLKVRSIDLSVQWEPLLHGKFVAKIWIDHPIINFVIDPKGHNDQLSINKIWIDVAKSLFPLNFNYISVQEGTVSFRNFSGHPPFNIFLENIRLHIHNIQNANKSSLSLPSTFDMTAFTADKAQVKVQGKFNAFKKEPTFYLEGRVENMRLQTLKSFLKFYSGLSVKSGDFSLYTEINAANGNVKGYAKPFVKNLNITSPKGASPLEMIYNGAASLAAKVFENPRQKTVATQINFEGKIEDPDTSILPIIFYALRHAFIQSLLPQIDHTIQVEHVLRSPK